MKSEPVSVDDVVHVVLYGRVTKVRVLAVRPHGTLDVERLSDGQCFRVSGLELVPPDPHGDHEK